MDGLTVRATGIDQQIRRMGRLQKIVSNPNIDAGVKAMGSIWDANFRGEGNAVGGWRDLTDLTNRLRISRGYPPAHPILVQSGSLKRVAIDTVRNRPQDASGDGVSLSYRRSPLSATLTVRGPKVSNQFRMRTPTSDQPARPFWFVNDQVEDAVASTIWDKMADALMAI